MSATLRTRVTAIAITCMLGALAGVGLGTSLLIHHRARLSLDEMMLSAVLAQADAPDHTMRFSNHHVEHPVQVQSWDPDAPIVPPTLQLLALESERPVWVDAEDQRILLLTVETDESGQEQHQVVVATARRVSWTTSTLPFLFPFVAASLFVTVVGSLVLQRAMAVVLAPLERASVEIGRVGAHAVGRRLEEAGPPEVRQLLLATNRLLGRLEDAFKTQASFTAQAAHELRTPVTILRGELELALRRPRSADEYRGVLEQIGADLVRLDDLVEGLLLLARVDTGQIEQGKSPEHLSTPIHRALMQEHDVLAAANCTVTAKLDVDPELPLHTALATTAISTLLRNIAVHAPGSKVRLETRLLGHVLELVISDDGPGIVEPERMQERFQRQGPGLGLGLPIAREIALRHGGDLQVDSPPEGGTTVRLSFDLAPP